MRRSFGGVRAVWDVDLDIAPGSIHALLGENGAGKSTLMNLVYGIHRADAGEVRVDGVVREIGDPRDAIAAGIAMVHQHHMLIPSFRAAETVALAGGPGRMTRNPRTAAARVRELAGRLGIEVDPEARVEDMTLAGRQRLEILSAVHRDARVMILDEPTAVLAPSEVAPFFALLRRMAEDGCSIVLITHRMREVFEVSDHISVMRRGRLVLSAPTRKVTREDVLAQVITSAAAESDEHAPHASPQGQRPVLEMRDVVVPASPGSSGLAGCTLELFPGEVLGIAGVEGNGQDEVVAVLAGMQAPAGGEIRLADGPLKGRPSRSDLTVVPSDRHHDGLVLELSVAENLVIDHLVDYARWGVLKRRKMRDNAQRTVIDYDVKTASVDAPVRRMSGGNQQKIVLARALASRPRVIVTAQATRGLDPGAARAVLDRLLGARDAGTAVIYIGSDLDELIEVADRICVLYGGAVTGTTRSPREDRAIIAAWMVGAAVSGAA